MKEEKSNIWKYFQQIGVIVAIIASFGTLIGIYYQVQTKKTQLELQLLSVDYLTSNNNIDNLSSNYKYKGIPVKNLWLLKFKIINTGDLTIIGKGKYQNLIGDKIKVNYISDVQILDNIELTHKEFPLDINKEDSVSFAFYFDQWRVNESASFSIYIKSEKKINDFLPVVVNRPIIDGDIFINDYRIILKTEKIPIIDYLPTPIPLIIRIVSTIIISLIILALISIFIYFYKEWLNYHSWKKNYFKEFKLFVTRDIFNEENNELFKTSLQKEKFKNEIGYIINSPWSLKDKYWKHFKGEKVPVSFPDIKSWKDLFNYIFIFLFLLFLFSSIILSLVKI